MTVTVVMEAMVAVVAEATGVATEMEAAVGVAVVEEAVVAEVVVATVVTVTTIEAAAEVVGVAAVTAGVVVAMTWVGGGQAGETVGETVVETAVVSRSSIRLTSAMRLVAEAEVTEVAAAAATAT